MTRRITAALGALICAATPLAAQVPTDSTPRFSRVVGVRELRDGRVIVADAGQLKVWLLQPDLRTGGQLGRTGTGEGEYQSADLLIPAGDTTLVFDILGSGLVQVGPDGAIGRTRPIRPASSAANAIAPEIRASDARGRIYYTGPVPRNRPPNATRDSVALLRREVAADRADTIAWLRVPVSGPRRAKDADSLIQSRPDPFEWRDTWAVDPAGRVAIVRGDDYRVEFIEEGRVTRGPTIGGTRVAVGEADIETLRARKFTVMGPNGPVNISDEPAHAITRLKPFVAEGQQAHLVDPEGRIWIERSRLAGDDTTRYDVIGRDGAVAFNVALKNDVRAVGFGTGTVYGTRPAEGGRKTLIRATLPR